MILDISKENRWASIEMKKKNSYFTFKKEVYKLVDGEVMGSDLSWMLSDTFPAEIEYRMF